MISSIVRWNLQCVDVEKYLIFEEIAFVSYKYMEASITEVHAHFSFGCGFMVGLSKLCTKFEVPSFSQCVNIEVEPQNFGELH